MSIFLQNLRNRSFIFSIYTVYKSSFQVAKTKLPAASVLIHFHFYQPFTCIHSSSVFSKQKSKEIKAKQKAVEYVSPRKRKKVVEIWKGMTIEELGEAIGENADHIFELMLYIDNVNNYDKSTDVLEWNDILDILSKANLRFRLKSKPKNQKIEDHDVYPRAPAPEEKLIRRPAVVTIMGHVDHGKTTLLDYLRKSSIVDSEFGGITQHIGAFSVKVGSNSITFLDTPGHAAFKAMRSRGAHCTDIVVLVVAADDGVMEQTEESINMAKDAKVPIIVAINKIDKQNADIVGNCYLIPMLFTAMNEELTKKMLMVRNLIPDDMGGDTQVVPISALKGTNIKALTEAIITQAELSNLRAEPDGLVEGVIIESKIDPYRGKLSTALICRGTLRKGCILTAGLAWCKVKIMLDDLGKHVEKAPPSTPVEITGWRELPIPGDIIIEVESEKRAHEVMHFREKKTAIVKATEILPGIESKRQKHTVEYKKKLLERRKSGFRKVREPRQKEIIETYSGPLLNVVIKSDVEGSLEALLDSLKTYYSPLCKLDVVSCGVGCVSLNDIETAELFNAVVYNFNVGVLLEAEKEAEKKKISIRPHNIIYRFLEDVKKEINCRIPSKEVEEVTGEATVMQLFMITEGRKKNIPVAGCRCTKGDLKKTSMFKVLRDGVEIHRGTLSSMKNFKTEVNVIKKEQECGLRFADLSIVFKPGDVIQSYRTYTVPQEVDWTPFHP